MFAVPAVTRSGFFPLLTESNEFIISIALSNVMQGKAFLCSYIACLYIFLITPERIIFSLLLFFRICI
jgi:hypothetical protein